jgi:rRNA maturation endonuclease Nob1
VNRLVCEDCGTVYYSAAAKTLVEQGATCAKCGGRLRLEDEPARRAAVTRPPSGDEQAD